MAQVFELASYAADAVAMGVLWKADSFQQGTSLWKRAVRVANCLFKAWELQMIRQQNGRMQAQISGNKVKRQQFRQTVAYLLSLPALSKKEAQWALGAPEGRREHLLRSFLEEQRKVASSVLQELVELEGSFETHLDPPLAKAIENSKTQASEKQEEVSRLLKLDYEQLVAEVQKKYALAATVPLTISSLNLTKGYLEI